LGSMSALPINTPSSAGARKAHSQETADCGYPLDGLLPPHGRVRRATQRVRRYTTRWLVAGGTPTVSGQVGRPAKWGADIPPRGLRRTKRSGSEPTPFLRPGQAVNERYGQALPAPCRWERVRCSDSECGRCFRPPADGVPAPISPLPLRSWRGAVRTTRRSAVLNVAPNRGYPYGRNRVQWSRLSRSKTRPEPHCGAQESPYGILH
jgi:hypothetical protein